jgi:hypothetical protein
LEASTTLAYLPVRLPGWALHMLMGRLEPAAVLAALDSHLAQVIDEQ